MKLPLSDLLLTNIARWIVILCPVFLLTGVMGNELPVSIVAMLFLYRSLQQRSWEWLHAPWVRLLLVLWAYIVLRSVFAEFWQPALALSASWIRFPVFGAALAFWILPDRKTQKRLMLAMFASVVFMAVDALIQYVYGADIFGHHPGTMPGLTRLTGPFDRPRVGIISAWLLIPVLAILGKACSRHKTPAYFALAGLPALLAVSAVYLSGERMAFLLTLMGCGLLLLLVRSIRWSGLALGIIATIVIMYLNSLNPDIKARQVDASHHQIAGFLQSPYGQIWISALRMAKQHPIFGVGSRNFRMLCPRADYGATDKDSTDLRCALHTHNIYSEWLAETGIIGLGIFLAVIAQWLRLCWNACRAILDDALLAGLVIAVTIRLWPLAATPSQFVSWSAMPMWLMIGFMLARLATPHLKQPDKPLP